jgi:hypothetical protein
MSENNHHFPNESARQIKQNRKAIFELESSVWNNKDQTYLTRDLVMENRSSIIRNYYAAFHGNRQLSNGNTDAMFRNRMAVIRSFYIGDNPMKNQYCEALSNKTKLEYLDHRSKLNENTTTVTKKIAEVNDLLIQINKDIMAMNEDVVDYNVKRIAENKDMIRKGVLGLTDATPEGNGVLIAANQEMIFQIDQRATENMNKLSGLYNAAEMDRECIEENTLQISDRRVLVEGNALAINANVATSASMICQR